MTTSTTSNETIYYNYGDGFVGKFENPHPEYKLWKTLPCGHQGLWICDRWVCQTCWGYEIPLFSYPDYVKARKAEIDAHPEWRIKYLWGGKWQ